MTEQYQQAPTETSRKTRASIATLGLAISMGATGLLLPRQGDHAIAAEPIPAPSISSPATAPANRTHTVQQSDTLATIARLHDIAPEALAAANNLALSASLQAGQQLTIPARSLPQAVVSTVEPATASADSTQVSISVDRPASEAADRPSANTPATEAAVTDEAVKVILNQAFVPALPDTNAEESKASTATEATPDQNATSSASAPSGLPQPITVSPLGAASLESLQGDERDRSANALERLQAQQERLNQALDTLATNTGTLLGSTTEAIELLALQPTPSQTSQDTTTQAVGDAVATEEAAPATAAVSLQPSQAAATQPSTTTISDTGLVASIPTTADNRVTAVAVPVQPLSQPAVPINATTALAAETGGGAASGLNALAGATDSPTASSRLQSTAAGATNSDLASPRYSPYIDGLRAEIQALQVRYQNQAQGTPARSGAISLLAPAAATAVAASQVPAAVTVAATSNSNLLTDRAIPTVQPMANDDSRDDSRRGQLVATAAEPLNERNPRIQTLLNASVSPQLPPLSAPSAYLPGAQPQTTMRGYIWPTQGTLTSGYGWRWGRMHRGIDIAAPIGTPVVAAASGVVVSSGWDSGGYGNKVDIRHPDGSVTRYAHNSRLLVRAGQDVRQGQLISEMGSTGRSTGPHLHFEVHPSGRGAINPMAFLPTGGLRAAR